MKRKLGFRRTATIGVCVAAVLTGINYFSQSARAQQQAGDVEVLLVKPNIYLIAGAGGNIVAQVGPDGVMLVDSGTTAMTGKVLDAIRRKLKSAGVDVNGSSFAPQTVTLTEGGA